uniref:Peptidase M56, BlaR1 n=1 Tax=Solibacter usitatus (strain Ellin6076) TaxID=234267 RepID=Q02AL8_SOLUE
MNLIQNWVETPAATALGWTLIHSLWEGAVVALLLAAALCVLRGARARYAAGCLALLVLLAGFGFTFARLLAAQGSLDAATRIGPLRFAPLDADAGSLSAMRSAGGLAEYLPWIAPFWVAGVLIFHLRSLMGWLGARRLRRTGVCCAPAMWQQMLERLAARLRISRPVTLWESCLADVPLVIGFLRPVILIPVGMLAGVPAAQVEALLLHELAHIRRHDYLVNLLQVFVEGLLFYHPAVWWMASAIRAEREHCCDDLVVATQGDAYLYASALAALEHNRGDARQPALAANGGSLVKRIRRLLIQPETSRSGLAPVLSAAILTVTVAAALAAWQTKPPAPPAPPAPAPAESPAPPPLPPAPPAPAPAEAPAPPPPVETPYAKWVKEDVAYIITDAERAAFKRLPTDEEREHFIEQFWQRRDPTPGTPVNEFKAEHYRRIAYANNNFSSSIAGWKTDRGRVYITYGPSDEKETHPTGGSSYSYPYEQWMYHFIDGVGKNIIVEFVDPDRTGEYRMTSDPNAALVTLPASSVTGVTAVQVLGGKAMISILPRGSQRLIILGRILNKEGAQVTAFEDTAQGPQQYVKSVPLSLGEYRLVTVVKDLATGRSSETTTSFSVK